MKRAKRGTEKLGLTTAAAKARLARFGLNMVNKPSGNAWRIFFRQFESPFVWLLLFCVGLTLFLHEYIDGGFILAFVLLNAGLGFFQEYRSERALQKLSTLTIGHAHAYRDGKVATVPTTELVPDDIILLRAGDILPADVEFISAERLSIDESSLTGESIPTAKYAEAKRDNQGFAQSVVVTGQGTAKITATGSNSRAGNLTATTMAAKRESDFAENVRKFSLFTLRMVGGALFVVMTLRGIFGHTPFLELLVFSVALAVSVIPEGMPLVTTFSLSRSALHLARKNVVVKRLSSIEDLGSIQILCTDKTGTLTENVMTVSEVWGEKRNLVTLCAQAGEFVNKKPIGAFEVAAAKALSAGERRELGLAKQLHETPFDPELRYNAVVVKSGRDAAKLIVRGAPEAVLAHCDVPPGEHKKIQAWMKEVSEHGCRTIAIATAETNKLPVPHEKLDLNLVGLIAFLDPLKPTALATLAEAEKLGVTIKIITGDGPEIAGAVAREAGLIKRQHEVITGPELAAMDHKKFAEYVLKHSVYARVSPEQKHQIINVLRGHGVVGFLGEGINDAPALKAAHVGMVVREASDIAREAADIILLEKSLEAIIDGIKEGRGVFTNTVKYIRATIASNFGNFYAMVIAMFLVPYLPMTAMQILLVNLLSDVPMMLIATDSVDDKELAHPQTYNLKEIAVVATLLGIVSTGFDLLFFSLYRHGTASYLQTNWFIGSILTELIFLFSIRTTLPFFRARRPSMPLVILSIIAATLTVAIPFSTLGPVFGFVKPLIADLALIIGLVLTYFVLTEIVKIVYYSKRVRV